MRTNIHINDQLIKEAKLLSKSNTKKEVVDAALKFFVRYLKRQKMLSLKGSIKWSGNLTELRSA